MLCECLYFVGRDIYLSPFLKEAKEMVEAHLMRVIYEIIRNIAREILVNVQHSYRRGAGKIKHCQTYGPNVWISSCVKVDFKVLCIKDHAPLSRITLCFITRLFESIEGILDRFVFAILIKTLHPVCCYFKADERRSPKTPLEELPEHPPSALFPS